VAFTLATLVGLFKAEKSQAPLRGMEAALTALGGAWLARIFIGLLLTAAGGSAGAGLAVGWAFFLWPGAVDTLLKIFGAGPALTTPAALLCFATVVGAFAGMMDGLWRIHRWRGPGALTFLVDMTWGLAGTTNGCLFHLFNFAWAGHANEPRHGAHRYLSGFRFKRNFAVTQGAVMSGMRTDYGDHGPASSLFRHEAVHVLQNRIFGPFFTLTYLGWMAALLLPGLVAGAASRLASIAETIEWWCYYDNPWEVWAYQVGGSRSHPSRFLCWSIPVAVASAAAFGLFAFIMTALTVVHVWG
jgi:hypothetical protein